MPTPTLVAPRTVGRGSRPARARRPRRTAATSAVANSLDLLLGAELAGQRGHPAGLDPAGHDPLERLQVVVDVDREAVRRDPAAARGSRSSRSCARRRRAAGRSPTQTPVRPSISRASTPTSPSASIIARSIARTYAWTSSGVGEPRNHDRIADELAGPVVGDAAAAIGLADLDSLHPVPVLAHRQFGRARAAALRVDGRVLEHQQRVGDLAGAGAPAGAPLHPRAPPRTGPPKLTPPRVRRSIDQVDRVPRLKRFSSQGSRRFAQRSCCRRREVRKGGRLQRPCPCENSELYSMLPDGSDRIDPPGDFEGNALGPRVYSPDGRWSRSAVRSPRRASSVPDRRAVVKQRGQEAEAGSASPASRQSSARRRSGPIEMDPLHRERPLRLGKRLPHEAQWSRSHQVDGSPAGVAGGDRDFPGGQADPFDSNSTGGGGNDKIQGSTHRVNGQERRPSDGNWRSGPRCSRTAPGSLPRLPGRRDDRELFVSDLQGGNVVRLTSTRSGPDAGSVLVGRGADRLRRRGEDLDGAGGRHRHQVAVDGGAFEARSGRLGLVGLRWCFR